MRTIEEVKTRLDGSVARWTCDVLALEPGRRATLRYVMPAPRTIGAGGLLLPAGTVTIAHYWMERPFNVYHWIADGRTIAYYANVAEMTEISDRRIAYRDLSIDIVLLPTGSLEVLDEDEIPPDLDPRDRKRIADALEELLTSPRSLIAEIERESAPHRS